MVSVASVTNKIPKKMSFLKGAGLASLLPAGLCIFDFTTVPGAFKLEYNSKGQKVEGTNWECGLKELGKSAIRCIGYAAVPALLIGAAAGCGVIGAALLGLASVGSTFVLSDIYEKILPSEQDTVEEMCKRKGISIKTDKGFLA